MVYSWCGAYQQAAALCGIRTRAFQKQQHGADAGDQGAASGQSVGDPPEPQPSSRTVSPRRSCSICQMNSSSFAVRSAFTISDEKNR
jgi:hypothetical protein